MAIERKEAVVRYDSKEISPFWAILMNQVISIDLKQTLDILTGVHKYLEVQRIGAQNTNRAVSIDAYTSTKTWVA